MRRLFYLALLFHYTVSEKLQVTTGAVTARLHDSVTIPCIVTGYNTADLDLQNVGVKWKFRSPNRTEEEVYLFNGKKHTSLRPGSHILEEELRKGNASLFIPDVRLSEAGSYQCAVYLSSNKVEGTASLSVLANPKVVLSSSAISVEVGGERSISCAISQFYPQNIEVQWFELSNGKLNNIVADICTGSLIGNPDGTFNMTSRLRLRPALEDNAKMYTCTVEHPTLLKNVSLSAELIVTEPRERNAIIIACLLGFAIGAAVMIAFIVYTCYFKAVPPKLSDISMPLKLVHEEPANISFQVTGFRPQNITINCFLGNNPLFQWRDGESGIEGQRNHSNDNVEIPLLRDGPFRVKPLEIEQHKDGTSSISCNITVFPDLHEHDGASLSIQIIHKALTAPLRENVSLRVVGVAPRLSKILMPHPIVQHEDCILTCLISNFKPKPIKVTWYRKVDGEHKEVTYHKEGHSDDASQELDIFSSTLSDIQFEDCSYCVTSTLKFKPTVKEHNNSVFVCETVHDSTGQKMSRDVRLKITAVPVLNPIQHTPGMPRAGEEITLTCKIQSFFPAQIETFWCKDGIPMNEIQQDCPVAEEANGLYNCISKITFAPIKMDEGKKISCCIKHASLLETKEVGWNMVPITVPPRISEIYSHPPEPELGKQVTLTCVIAEFFPENCTVLWTCGESSADSNYKTIEETPTINQETGLFNMKTSITFKARGEDHGKEIFLKVFHYATMVKPEEKRCLFLLKGVPTVSDIIVEPQCFGYGQPISLTGSVAGFYPKHITVGWYKSGSSLEDLNNMMFEDERGFFNLKSTLALTLTALDYNEDISFLVNHPRLIQPTEKQAGISLSALPPTLSEIDIIPVEPEVNKLLTIRVVINDYAPGNIEVRWFKSNRSLVKDVTSTKPQIGRNGLYSSESQVQLMPSTEDHNRQLKCEVLHLETNKVTEKSYILNLKGCSLLSEHPCSPRSPGVLLDLTDGTSRQSDQPCIMPPIEDTEGLKIRCLTMNPKAGEEISLCCIIPHCHSNDTGIYWYKGMYPVNVAKIRNEDYESGCTSYVTIETAKGESECDIRCEVMNEELREDVCYTLTFI